MGVFDGTKSNSVTIDGADYLISALQSLPEVIGQKYLRRAITAGMKPVEAQLLANTPQGPTGNLRKAVGNVVRDYGNGVVFGVVGYKRFVSTETADARGFHSHFLEFGTNDRYPKEGPFLSSYGIRQWTPPGWRGIWPMRAKMVRGAKPQQPLGKAFEATRSQALAIVMAEMQSGLDKGIEETRRKGLS
jgi:HK97 gp10 family phage protein